MNEEITILLDKEIVSELEQLSGKEGYEGDKSKVIDNIDRLYRLKLEETKVIEDSKEKEHKRSLDIVESKKQIQSQYLKIGVDLVGITLPLVFSAVWMNKGFKFEETGTFTSSTFKWLFGKFKTTK